MTRTLLTTRRAIETYSGPLLAWADGTFARASEGSYQTSAAALAWAAANTRRTDLVVFGESLSLIESQRENLAIANEDFSGWSAVLCTVANNAGTAPDGAGDASTVAYNAASNPRLVLTIALSNNTIVSQSRWVKSSAGNGNSRLQLIQKDAGTEISLDSTATGTWVREQQRGISVGMGGSNPQFWHRAPADGLGPTIFHWGAQLELGRYETSQMRTGIGTFIRDADQATWLAAEVPLLLREKPSKIRCAPWWAHGDLVSGDTHVLYSWGVDDELRIRHDGSNVILEAVVGGVQKATKTIGSITRRTAVYASADPVAGTVSWDGVAGSAGTAWAWPAGQFRLGGELGGSSEWDGGLDLPATVL